MSADEMTLITHPRAIARERVNAEVIARSLREPEAFAEIFDRHAADLYRYIRRRLGDGVSDDVLAETFTVAFARRRRYDLARPDARPWLYGIATRLISGHRRTESRRLSALSRTPVPDGSEPMADRVAEELTARAARPELHAALAALPARQRDVVLLLAWAELDYQEIAEALHVPVGTVRSRLHRARVALRRGRSPSDSAGTPPAQPAPRRRCPGC
jgi:RNA polymerase sigma-70 factor (ECF subfamily)